MKRFAKSRLLVLLAVIGPGIITSAADNDAGGITTYAVAGALYRYDLLWVMVVLTVILAMVQEMCARMGVVTQKGLGELIRENFGVRWTMFALGILLIANLATTVSEFAGIAASLELFGISRYISVPVSAILVWTLVVKFDFQVVKRVFMFLSVIYITYVIAGIMSNPDWGEVLHSTVMPKLGARNMTPAFMFLAIAIIGTTITPWMQFFLQATVVESGTRMKNYKYQKWDVFIGSFMTDFVSFFIIVAAGATVFGTLQGGHVKEAADVARALEPVAGKYAEALFAIGLFNASLLAAAVLPLSTAYTYSEAFGWEMSVSRIFREAPFFYGVYTFCIIFGAGVVLLPNLGLIDAMIRAQAINGILLPIILVFMLKLVNNREVMGKHVNSWYYNIAVWGIAAIIIAMTLATVFGALMGY